MSEDHRNRWDKTKEELNSNIDKLLEESSQHEDILLIMKEMLKVSKVRTSIEEYYEDTK